VVQVQEASRIPNDITKIEPLHGIAIVKETSTENKDRILMVVRDKCQITNNGKPTKITEFSTEALKRGHRKRDFNH
jgi:hypothetical protein